LASLCVLLRLLLSLSLSLLLLLSLYLRQASLTAPDVLHCCGARRSGSVALYGPPWMSSRRTSKRHSSS
jgi:hypothetical protein